MYFSVFYTIALGILLIPLWNIYILFLKLRHVEKDQMKGKSKLKTMRKECRTLTESLRTKNKKLAKNQKPKGPKGLEQSSVECILSFMDASKRLCLSQLYPKIRPIEKSVPMVLNFLHISKFDIETDKNIFEVHEDHRTNSLVPKTDPPVFVTVMQLDHEPKCATVLSKICFDLFAGRTQFEVGLFETEVPFPCGIDFKCRRALVRSDQLAENYSNIGWNIETALFQELDRPENLRVSWVRNVKVLESVAGDCRLFVTELRNIFSRKIFIDCRGSTHHLVNLIIGWCLNKKRPVGSELFLAMTESEKEEAFRKVLASNTLVSFGFTSVEDNVLRLPLENNLEVVLKVPNDSTSPKNYLLLEVQNSQL